MIIVSPLTALAVTVTIHPAKRSSTYSMGIVPYYVYGSEITVNTEKVVKMVKKLPKMPLAGAGGKAKMSIHQ